METLRLYLVLHVGDSYVTRELGRCLEALAAVVALKGLLPQMNPLVKVQLALVLEAAMTIATDHRLALLVDELVKAQRVRRLERGRALVALVRPCRAVRLLLVRKEVELIGEFSGAEVALVRLAAHVHLLVHLQFGVQ